jgi:hypothetical protein
VKQASNEAELFVYLDELIADARGQGSRLGYFPASYRFVAQTIYARMRQGAFAHPELIDAMALGLFNRYFEALQEYQAGQMPTRAWLLAFEAARDSCPTVAQQIMISINAHINVDLGAVVARASAAGELSAMNGDFQRMVGILAPLVDTIVASLGQVSWLFGVVYGPIQNIPINFAVREMARHAWDVALKLIGQGVEEQARTLAATDARAELLGRGILGLTPALAPFRLTEHATVEQVLSLLEGLGEHSG